MHVEVKTIPSNAEVAESLGLKLCEACGQPQELHCGVDRGSGACLCDFVAVRLNGLISIPQKKELVRRLTEFYETVSRNEEVRRVIGAGI